MSPGDPELQWFNKRVRQVFVDVLVSEPRDRE